MLAADLHRHDYAVAVAVNEAVLNPAVATIVSIVIGIGRIAIAITVVRRGVAVVV